MKIIRKVSNEIQPYGTTLLFSYKFKQVRTQRTDIHDLSRNIGISYLTDFVKLGVYVETDTAFYRYSIILLKGQKGDFDSKNGNFVFDFKMFFSKSETAYWRQIQIRAVIKKIFLSKYFSREISAGVSFFKLWLVKAGQRRITVGPMLARHSLLAGYIIRIWNVHKRS